jgi:polyisoprenoid-binding protein YceI
VGCALVVGTLVPALVLGSAGGALAATLRIDPARSRLVAQVFKEGLGSGFAHDHVIRATQVTGTVEYDAAAPDRTAITVEVPAASLRADEPALRQEFGLTSALSTSDRADVEKAMRAPDQLDVSRFPTIRFVSTRVGRQPDGRLLVTGTLTIRGVSREVTFPAEVTSGEAGAVRGRATLTLRQSSFGYQPYRAALGTVRNKDELTLLLDLWAAP